MNSKRQMKVSEIDLLSVLGSIWKKKYIIILVTVLCGMLMGLRSAKLLTPTYTASVTMYGNNSTVSEGSDSISAADLSTSIKLVKACEAIIKSDPVLEQVAADLGIGTWDLWTVNVYSVNETQVFKVDVTSTSPEMAAKIANTIAVVAPEKIAGIVDGCSVKSISPAKVPTAKSWPSNRSEAMKGAVVGFALSLFAVCVITLLDTRIKNEGDLDRWDYPILGIIPSFTASQKGGAYASASKGGKK